MPELQKQIKNKIEIRYALNLDFRKILKIEKELNLPITSLILFKSLVNEQNVIILEHIVSREIYGFLQFRGDNISSEIITLGIKKKYQNTGFGRKLFDYIVKKGYKNIFLEVSNLNKKGIKFYKNIGFKEISRRKKYYENNKKIKEDALLMNFTKT